MHVCDWAALVPLPLLAFLALSLHVLCPASALPCRLLLRSHPLLATMGALIVGTVLFALMTVLAYFCVSVVWRNDKDSQAYVAAAVGEEQSVLFCVCCVLLPVYPVPRFSHCFLFVWLADGRHVHGHRMSAVWQRHHGFVCGQRPEKLCTTAMDPFFLFPLCLFRSCLLTVRRALVCPSCLVCSWLLWAVIWRLLVFFPVCVPRHWLNPVALSPNLLAAIHRSSRLVFIWLSFIVWCGGRLPRVVRAAHCARSAVTCPSDPATVKSGVRCWCASRRAGLAS